MLGMPSLGRDTVVCPDDVQHFRHQKQFKIYFPPKTNMALENSNGWKMIHFLLKWSLFWGHVHFHGVTPLKDVPKICPLFWVCVKNVFVLNDIALPPG